MSRYKITFASENKFLSNSKHWSCTIYDRKTEREYSGYGDSKAEAKNDAWDRVYQQRTNNFNHNRSSEELTSETIETVDSSDTLPGIFLVCTVLLGCAVYFGYTLLESQFLNFNGRIRTKAITGFIIMIASAIGMYYTIKAFIREFRKGYKN